MSCVITKIKFLPTSNSQLLAENRGTGLEENRPYVFLDLAKLVFYNEYTPNRLSIFMIEP